MSMCKTNNNQICQIVAVWILLFAFNSFLVDGSLLTPTSTNGTTSETYYVSANEDLFENNDIICTKSTCNVICARSSSCQGLFINASQSNILTIRCSQSNSCQNISITSGAQISTKIDCIGYRSCSHAIFDLANSPIVTFRCDDSSYVCNSAIINASLSTNLNVDCDSQYSCYHADIICPLRSGDTECNVTCNGMRSCRAINVFIKDKKYLNLNCGHGSYSQYTCSGAVYCGGSTSATRSDIEYFDITGEGWGCFNVDCCPFYEGYISCTTSTCIVDCEIIDCSGYLIDGTSANNSFTVNCNAINGGCRGAIIRCPHDSKINSPSCTVNCQHDNSCEQTIINAANAYSLDLYCSGSAGCKDINVHCPYNRVSACNIDCSSGDYHVCYNIGIIVQAAYTYNYLSLLCPNTNHTNACYSGWFDCKSFWMWSKEDVSLTWDTTENQYVCGSKSSFYCCPWPNENVLCSSSDCGIDCGSYICDGVIINGKGSSFLNIECDSYECPNSMVYCASTSCTIICNNTFACDRMIIYANDTTTVKINCFGYHPCDNMILYADSTSYLTFDSSSHYSPQIKIYANNAGTVTLVCNGQDSCKQMDVYADYSESITIYAEIPTENWSSSGVDCAFCWGEFHASNAGYVSITCSSGSDQNIYGCFSIQWYLPSSNTFINCYDYGCYHFGTIYVDTSISSLHLNIEGCRNDTPSSCINKWNIVCKSSDATYISDSFNGKNCSSDYCGCNAIALLSSAESDTSNGWKWYYTVVVIIAGLFVLFLIMYSQRKQFKNGYSQPVDVELEQEVKDNGVPNLPIPSSTQNE